MLVVGLIRMGLPEGLTLAFGRAAVRHAHQALPVSAGGSDSTALQRTSFHLDRQQLSLQLLRTGSSLQCS